MKALGYLLAACVALAVLKAVAVALAIGLCIAIGVGVITRPRETLGLLGLMLMASLVEKHSLVLLGMVALLSVAAVVCKKAD